jgi:hypothetical protein
MTLTRTTTDPVRLGNRFGWAIPMRTDDGKEFRVIVTDDALLGIGSPCVSGIPQLSGEYRLKIEEIASAKHTGGVIEQDGSLIITQADVH